MNEAATVIYKNNFPVFTLLGGVLVVLKALGLISLPWIWVLAPFWFPVAFLIGFLTGGLLIAGVVFLVAWIADTIQLKARRRRIAKRNKNSVLKQDIFR
jgi:hypothetical protein